MKPCECGSKRFELLGQVAQPVIIQKGVLVPDGKIETFDCTYEVRCSNCGRHRHVGDGDLATPGGEWWY